MQKRTLGKSGLTVSALASQITVQGARYPEHLERRTGL
jgi:hypothetical protein